MNDHNTKYNEWKKASALKLEKQVKKSTTYLSETCLLFTTIREWELQLTHQPVVIKQEILLHLSQSTILEAAPRRRLPEVGVKIRLRVQYNSPVRLKSKGKKDIAHKVLKLPDVTWNLHPLAAFTATSTYQAIIDFTKNRNPLIFLYAVLWWQKVVYFYFEWKTSKWSVYVFYAMGWMISRDTCK